MRWFKTSLAALQEATTTAPIACPRGWGEVSFTLETQGFLPFLDISRRCPIGGVSSCTQCAYPIEPTRLAQLRDSLTELDELRRDRTLSEDEYAMRRRMLIGLQTAPSSAEGFRTSAWVLGPLGLVLSGIGAWCGVNVDEAFWIVAALGAIAVTLSLSFAMLASRRSRVDQANDIL